MEEKGYIYILTNESFHKTNWVKIGYTNNVERRVKELSNTSVPLPFEVYATYEVPVIGGTLPDKQLHALIQKLNPELRITQDREFFEIEPWDAYDILYAMAVIHGRLDKLKRYDKNTIGNEMIESKSNEISDLDFFDGDDTLRKIYDKFESLVLKQHPDLKVLYQKHYIAFRKGKKHNVLTVRTKKDCIEVALNAKLGSINDSLNVIYDISNRMWSASQYAFKFDDETDVENIKSLVEQTYNNVK